MSLAVNALAAIGLGAAILGALGYLDYWIGELADTLEALL